jgi:hypothetical protein
VLSEDPKVF